MFKSFVIGIAAGLVILVIVLTGASRVRQERAEQARYQAELEGATRVQVGVLTERQRFHSKRFAQYREIRINGLTELIARAKREGRSLVETNVGVGLIPVLEPQTPHDFFGDLAANSDAVILGRVTSKDSQVTENDGFVFTDYDVAVARVFKNNAAAGVAPGSTITVTWPGGKVLVDGVIVIAKDENRLPLPINKRDVVLFLRFLPETGGYYGTRYCAAFELDGTAVLPLTNEGLPPGVIQDRDSFVETVETAATH